MFEAIVVLGSLLVALVIALAGIVKAGTPPPGVAQPSMGPFSGPWAARVTLGGVSVWSGVGPPGWDFTKSWATNITILGAIVTSFLSSKIVGHSNWVPDNGYALLSVLFAGLVASAPLIFRALSTEKAVLSPQGTNDIQYQGNAAGFLMAAGLTLWGAIGQLATVSSLSAEVVASKTPHYGATIPLLVGLVATAVATVAYARATIEPLLQHQANLGGHAGGLVTQMQNVGAAPPADFQPTDAPLPGWRVL